MGRVVHFEINSDNPEVARRFYKKVFGWEISKQEGDFEYWLIKTGEDDKQGINGAIKGRKSASEKVVNTINVQSIDDSLNKILDYGGTIMHRKEAVTGVGYTAYFKDVDGNTFCLFEDDKNAKPIDHK